MIFRVAMACGVRGRGLRNDVSPQNDNELAPPRTQLIALTFGVKLVSKYGDWSGFAGSAVS